MFGDKTLFSAFVYEPISTPQRYRSGQSTSSLMTPCHQRMWAEVFESLLKLRVLIVWLMCYGSEVISKGLKCLYVFWFW